LVRIQIPLNLKLETRNPKPGTRNPGLGTRNPTPGNPELRSGATLR